uniref:Uncharacterized protein n=1 Tax=Rhizophora mucronata TaxID=61149 RepID=A0A2P2QKS1_RHIMU
MYLYYHSPLPGADASNSVQIGILLTIN